MNYKRILLVTLSTFAAFTMNAEKVEIYVSPLGNDGAAGTLSAPFKTLYRAQKAIQKAVAADKNAEVSVILRDGRYELNRTLVLGFKDVAQEGSLTFQAYNNETPVLSTGKQIDGWRKVTEYPEGTPEAAKGNLWEADVPEPLSSFRTLFDGDSRLVRAKSDRFRMNAPSEKEVRRADSRNVFYNKDRIHLRRIPFTNQIKDWSNLHDIEVFFNPVPWNINMIQLESVDMDNKVAYLSYEANAVPFSSGKKAFAWVENVIDYLDQPGEWCLNSDTRKVYYWPVNGQPSNRIYAPQLMEAIRVEGRINYDLATDEPVKNIHFKGIKFTHGDRTVWYKNRKGWGIQHDWDTFDYGNALLRFRGAENCSVEECAFVNSGGSAMRLDLHAQHITISKNYIDRVGHMGILLCGYGPGTKDVNKYNTITNNIIQRCGQIVWHGHGIFAWQSGENTISHNYIHDVPRKAIGLCGVRCQILMKPECNFDEASRTIRWYEIEQAIDSTEQVIINRYAPFLHARNNKVEDNRVERTMLELSDGSSINVSGAGLGNLVNHNLLYDIPFVGIRTDDWQDGTMISNNILHNIGGTGITHKGLNHIMNNILINCNKFSHYRAYPQQYFYPGSMIQHNIYYTEAETYVPSTVFKWGQMFVHRAGKKPLPYEYDMDYNVYYSHPSNKLTKAGRDITNAKFDLALKQKNGVEEHSVIMDPRFKNIKEMDYRIGNKKMIKAIDFKLFDVSVDSFGITQDYPAKYRQLDTTLQK